MLFCTNPELEQTVCALLHPVGELLQRPDVQEISANWHPQSDGAYLYADYGVGPMLPVDSALTSSALAAATLIIASDRGLHIAPDAPLLECNLVCGARYAAVLPPVADGARFSIRTHYRHDWLLADFANQKQSGQLAKAVLGYKSILAVGATSSGKTSFVSALLDTMPVEERLIVIEDTPELRIREGNVVRSKTTPKVPLQRLVKAALRERPDWIVVGEVRGPEAYDLIDAASTGHPVISTVHASSAEGGLARLSRLANCDYDLVREQISLVVFLKRMADGRRQVTEILER